MKLEDKIIAKSNLFVVAQELDLFRRKLLDSDKRPDLQKKFQSYFDMLTESLDYFQEMDLTITESNKEIAGLKQRVELLTKENENLKKTNQNLQEGL